MSKYLLMVFNLVLLTLVHGEQPILVADYLVDSALYDDGAGCFFKFAVGPYMEWNDKDLLSNASVILHAYHKKNSNEVDIYSYTGKCGTSFFPVFGKRPEYTYLIFWLSRYFVDADPKWETIVNYDSSFVLLDDDGTELLKDSGIAGYGFDGNNTYILTLKKSWGMKTWKLRTSISSGLPPSMAKRKSEPAGMMQVYGFNDGQYRVTLSPTAGNSATFQLFDLLGRCVLTKDIQNLTTPVTFTIPEEHIPNTAFIAKTKSGSESALKKIVPVK